MGSRLKGGEGRGGGMKVRYKLKGKDEVRR